MLKKRIIFILFLSFIMIGTISSVNANGLDSDLTNVSYEDVGIDGSIDDVFDEEDNDDSDNVLGMADFNGEYDDVNPEDILESSSKGTFTELQNKINNAKKGSTIYLTKDYCYNKDFGSLNGIRITKPITIDGKGHSIDGLGKSSLLLILKTNNVVLKNIVFKDGVLENDIGVIGIFYSNNVKFNKCNFYSNYADSGGAAYLAYSNYSSFVNCNFDSNTVDSGGAVYLGFSSSSFVGCNFNENDAEYGAAVYSDCSSSSFVGCNFNKNDAKYGAAVYFSFSSSSFESCTFYKNRVTFGYGGAVYSDCSSSSFVGCSFDDNLAGIDGSALYLNYSSSSFESCNFHKNIADWGSGAICSIQSCLNILNTDFNDNAAYAAGGDIYSQYGMIFLANSSFFDSYTPGFGGSLSFDNDYVEINDCTFEECLSIYGGGAIYCLNSILNVLSSGFKNCSSLCGGAICSLDTDLVIKNDSFDNTKAPIGGAIYTIYGSITVDKSIFSYSYAVNGGIMYISSPHVINNITDNLFLYSSAKGRAQRIYVDGYYAEIPEKGNIYEDIYFVIADVTNDLDDGKYSNFSNVLTYVLSNSNEYLNDLSFYDDLRDDFISKKGFISNDSSMNNFNIFDECYSNNSSILLNPNSYNGFVICNGDYFNNEFNSSDSQAYFYNLRGDELEHVYTINDRFSFDFDDMTLFYNRGNIYDFKTNYNPVPLFNPDYYPIDDLPSYYLNEEYITPVKNQDVGSNCWAFSGIATLEACLKKITGEEYDFSENNAKNLMSASSVFGLNFDSNSGGLDSMFIGYLASWLGPVDEKMDKYNPRSSVSMAFRSGFHIQDILFLPARHNSSDNDAFKNAIYNYGAVSVVLNWTANNISKNFHWGLQRGIISGNFYWKDDGYKGFHSISIVGWDDEYNNYDSLGNYAEGAWIFKNSWSEFWEDDGFGYLSYEQNLSSEIAPYMHAYTFVFKEGDVGYQDIYQYDFAGVTDYLCTDTDYIYYKNRFTARDDEFLYAFSTYFENPSYFMFYVRINGEDISMTEDNVTIVDSVHYSPAGYHTIPLGYNLTLNEGDEFEIVIILLNVDGNGNYVPVCQADELYKLSYPSNVSFISYDGKDWVDLYYLDSNNKFAYGGNKSDTCQVACIKAFTAGWRYDSIGNSDNGTQGERIILGSYDIYQLEIDFSSDDDRATLSINITDWDSEEMEWYENFVELHINDKLYYLKVIDGMAYLNTDRYVVSYDEDDEPSVEDKINYFDYDEYGYYTCSAKLKSSYFTSNLVRFFINRGELYLSTCLNTFSELQEIIDCADEESVITLDKNYYFDDDFNCSFILIDKSLTIDGDGHSLYGLSKSGIFKIGINCSVTLKNINFINGVYGAIFSYGTLSISNCNFSHNSAYFGGAIRSFGNLSVSDCIFEDNSANYGGAISSFGNLSVSDCIFEENYADWGNVIYSEEDCFVVNSAFYLNCTEFDEAIYMENAKCYSDNLSFNDEIKSVLMAQDLTIVYGKSDRMMITIKDVRGKPIPTARIKITVNGREIWTIITNLKGQAHPLFDYVVRPKTYTLTISYAGNYKYSSASIKVKLVIKKATPKITASKKTFKVKTKTKKYTITLKNNLEKAMKNKKVTIKVNGKTYKAKTNSKGKATFKITKLNKKGKFKATIKYAGNEYYKAVSKKVTITVKK